MNLLQIPQKQTVIIDTNIFVYAAQRISVQCIKLLEKCAKDELYGIIPVHILTELTHVLMLAEARDLGLIRGQNPAKQLLENPNKVKVLNRYESLIRDLLSIGLTIESLQREDFLTTMSLQRQYGLLTNDALFLAVATRLRVTAVISADSIFKSITGITHYFPDDLDE
jgi:predicted nucleic acid-binding protein